MDVYIKNLINGLEKRHNKIKYSIEYAESNKINLINYLEFPSNVSSFYNSISSLDIREPRKFELFSLESAHLLDKKFLFFSKIDGQEKICFNISYINEAGEWDIIDYNSNYLITKTIASYLTNKIWAWIDRGREIWKEEFI